MQMADHSIGLILQGFVAVTDPADMKHSRRKAAQSTQDFVSLCLDWTWTREKVKPKPSLSTSSTKQHVCCHQHHCWDAQEVLLEVCVDDPTDTEVHYFQCTQVELWFLGVW